ncbi:hypothetical protein APHAL10511_004773 [Amanita phalloides]|nr:hypothetical protein APHAL10511_004773 [Amanita phalloides]
MAWLPRYLERSGTCPLKVYMDTYDVDKRSTDTILALLAPIFQLLVDHFDRVQYFFWLTYRESTVEGCTRYFADIAAPVLQQFHVLANKHRVPGRASGAPRTIFNGGAPRLTVVDIEATWTIPHLENVKTLSLGFMCTPEGGFGRELVRITNCAPNLEHLCIDRTHSVNTFAEVPPATFILRSLRSLKLTCDPISLDMHLLRILGAPQLESLWLCCPPHHSLTHFLVDQRVHGGDKFPSLRYLTLQHHDFTNTQLFSNAFPSVIHLHLLYPHTSSFDITAMLKSFPPAPVPWPNLRTLAIQSIHDAYTGNYASPSNLLQQLRTVMSFRSQTNSEIETILLDSDLYNIISKWTSVGENVTLEKISQDNYQEYWWNVFEDDAWHVL